jgi:hypothetical protein
MSLGNWAVSQLKDAAGAFFGGEYLRDYTHASKTFRTNSYQYAPKLKFLFHVYFDINQAAYSVKQNDTNNLSLTVKSVQLPSYTFKTHTMNQYNRKRIVQTKVEYDPIELAFHDDNLNVVRNMWFNYFSYYYNDANKPMTILAGRTVDQPEVRINNQPSSNGQNNDYNTRNLYQPSLTGDNGWGYIGENERSIKSSTMAAIGSTKIPFFKNITIFGFNQHNFVAYTLVNPVITRFAHDQYNYSEGSGIMENKMTVDYETVKYFDGAINGRTPGAIVTGFGNPGTYDRTLSPIARPGSQATILGQGGLKDAASGVMEDLAKGNILGAIQKSGTAYNTFKNVNLKKLATSELISGVTNAVQQTPNRNVNFQFPVARQTPGAGQAGTTTGQASPAPVTPTSAL